MMPSSPKFLHKRVKGCVCVLVIFSLISWHGRPPPYELPNRASHKSTLNIWVKWVGGEGDKSLQGHWSIASTSSTYLIIMLLWISFIICLSFGFQQVPLMRPPKSREEGHFAVLYNTIISVILILVTDFNIYKNLKCDIITWLDVWAFHKLEHITVCVERKVILMWYVCGAKNNYNLLMKNEIMLIYTTPISLQTLISSLFQSPFPSNLVYNNIDTRASALFKVYIPFKLMLCTQIT